LLLSGFEAISVSRLPRSAAPHLWSAASPVIAGPVLHRVAI
jgi:hypothetical protein